MKHWIIYMYTFPNEKRYIGKSCRSLRNRQGKEFCNYERCTVLYRAIQKYGAENIVQTVLFENDMEDEYACRLEQICIALFKTNCCQYKNPSYGYNLTNGGEGVSGWHPDEDRYKELCKMLEVFADRRRGEHPSIETRTKMSISAKKRKYVPMSEETKRKISIANSRENMTEETRIRRSNSKKKKIIVIKEETGEIMIFDSMTECAEYFHVAPSMITRYCNETRKNKYGYKFQYLPTTTESRERYCM